MAKRLLEQGLQLNVRRLGNLHQGNLVAQGLQQGQQLQQLRPILVGEHVNLIGAVLDVFRGQPDTVRQRAVALIAEAEAVGAKGQFGLHQPRLGQQAAAMAATAIHHGAMHRLPIGLGQALRRTKGRIHPQGGRVKADGVLVAAGAEAKPVVEALVEDAEHGERRAVRGPGGQLASRDAQRQAELAGDPAGHDRGDRAHGQVLTHARRKIGDNALISGGILIAHRA